MILSEENETKIAVELLQQLITVPSFSNEENNVADIWEAWLRNRGVRNVKRFYNNVYCLSESFNSLRPTLLLNSHMDTVRPVTSYTHNPFNPEIIDGKLYGLGSNDAGGSGVALAMTFLNFQGETELPFNIIFAITASEERMGEFGMRAFLPYLKDNGIYPEMAIVGEPTECKAAVAERGLVVCDAEVEGKAGHAARNEGINAIYRACEDIGVIKKLRLEKESNMLGPVKFSVTMIDAGTQHNVVPDKCKYVVDIRTTEVFSNEETVRLLQEAVKWSRMTPRSTRIHASVLSTENPLYKTAIKTGLETFVSPTTSDMALMYDIASIKIGPGKSQRSHSADEFIYLDEIREGIITYKKFIRTLKNEFSF